MIISQEATKESLFALEVGQEHDILVSSALPQLVEDNLHGVLKLENDTFR
jgi:hypothetical protein